MARRPWQPVLDHLRSLAARCDSSASDAELLSQFIARRDEDAFAALLRRHGAMVLRVARRVLSNDSDAEDVFQATFLLLARRADAIRKREAVAGWLHGVAHRLALSARAQRQRRQERERQAAETRPTETPATSAWSELEETLHEVLAQLPEKYRTPLVSCYLEGRTQEEVAQQLGAPLGTVRSWLARGRELLRKRLLRRGISLSVEGASAALLVSACATAEAVPPMLRLATLKAVHLFATGGNAMMSISPSVADLVRQGMTTLLVAKLKSGAACVLIFSLLLAGSGWAAHRRFVAEPSEPPQAKRSDVPPKQADSAERPRTDLHGDPLPQGAVARLGTQRFRHEDMLAAFAVSPDGRTLAGVSSLFGKSATLWDYPSGRFLRRLTFDHEIHFLTFLPDGKSLALGAPWTPKGETGLLHVLDLASGKETHCFAGHHPGNNSFGDRAIGGAAFFTPDGRKLVTLGGDTEVIFWNVQSGKIVHRLPGGCWMAWGLSPDGKLLAVRQDGSKILRLFEVATGKEVRQLSHPFEVRGAAFSPDGKTLATAYHAVEEGIPGTTKITLWQVENGKELGTFSGHQGSVFALAFSPDGKYLASGGIDRTLRLWDIAAKKEKHEALMLPTSITQLAYHRDGKTLITLGKENHVRLWDVASWKERVEAEGPNQAIVAVAYSPDGKQVASVCANDGLWLWDANTGRLKRKLENAAAPVRFSADGKSATAGFNHSDHLYIWDTTSGEVKQRIPGAGTFDGYGALSPDGKTLACADHRATRIHLWRVGSKETRRYVKPSSEKSPEKPLKRPNGKTFVPRPQVLGVGFSPDSKILYACGTGTHIYRWDAVTGRELACIGKNEGDANGIAPSPDGRSVAIATLTGNLYLWEIASGQPRLVVKDADCVAPIAFSPDGRLLASTTKKGEIQLVAVASGKVLRRFTGHLGQIRSLLFSPDSRALASGGYDSTVLVWDVAGSIVADPKNGAALTAEQLGERWAELRGSAAESYRGMNALVAAPTQAVPFLGKKLEPTTPELQRFAPLLAKLDSDSFAERETATRELKKLGESAEPALRKALQDKPSLESRRRLQALLDGLDGSERLRTLRAIEVLERIGDKPARALLRRLSEGAA